MNSSISTKQECDSWSQQMRRSFKKTSRPSSQITWRKTQNPRSWPYYRKYSSLWHRTKTPRQCRSQRLYQATIAYTQISGKTPENVSTAAGMDMKPRIASKFLVIRDTTIVHPWIPNTRDNYNSPLQTKDQEFHVANTANELDMKLTAAFKSSGFHRNALTFGTRILAAVETLGITPRIETYEIMSQLASMAESCQLPLKTRNTAISRTIDLLRTQTPMGISERELTPYYSWIRPSTPHWRLQIDRYPCNSGVRILQCDPWHWISQKHDKPVLCKRTPP